MPVQLWPGYMSQAAFQKIIRLFIDYFFKSPVKEIKSYMYSISLCLKTKQTDKGGCSRSRGAQLNVPSWFQRVINLIFIVSLPWRFVETIQRERTQRISHVWSPTVPWQLAACASPAEPRLSWPRAGAGRPVTSQLWLVRGSQMWFIGRDMNHGLILEPDALRGTCSLSLIIWVKPEHRRSGDRGFEFGQWTQRLVNTANDADY